MPAKIISDCLYSIGAFASEKIIMTVTEKHIINTSFIGSIFCFYVHCCIHSTLHVVNSSLYLDRSLLFLLNLLVL